MPTFKITTLGCKVNQAESDCIAGDLLAGEWLPAHDPDPADLCIINTCTVTQKASMQSRQAIRQALRANPNAQIVVTGCYAQAAPKEIQKIKGVNYIVGHGNKNQIGRMFKTHAVERSGDTVFIGGSPHGSSSFASTFDNFWPARTRPFLKIQDGCDAFCTYCIVPYARGRSRSMPPHDVLNHIKQLAAAGFHEVVMAGIHLGTYGRDLSPATNLLRLLGKIQEEKTIERIRLSSIEPLELTDAMIECVAASDIFCRHFHIPLQSGDDGILKMMGRPYTRQIFHDLILKIKQRMPDAAIGVDTLIGFPGESEAAFENTYQLIEKLPVSYLHVFPFSPRPGTVASKFPNRVPAEIVKKRCEQMRKLGNKKRMAFYRNQIGQTVTILCETQRDGRTGLLKGISSNYLPVWVNGADNRRNQMINVRIENLTAQRLFGSPTA
jgi:threonylcarbamoyladenosine tRNA methylthiotransferase MtaB